MSTLIKTKATKVWFDNDNVWLLLEDGRQVSVPLAFYPRLLNATIKQRKDFTFIGHGVGIHWPALDEDLSVEGILIGKSENGNTFHGK